jgi:hypothetical protein
MCEALQNTAPSHRAAAAKRAAPQDDENHAEPPAKKSSRISEKKKAASAAAAPAVQKAQQPQAMPVLPAPPTLQLLSSMITPPPAAVNIKRKKESASTLVKPAMESGLRSIFREAMAEDVPAPQAWLQRCIQEKITTVSGLVSFLMGLTAVDKEDREETLAHIFGRPTTCDDRRRFETAVHSEYTLWSRHHRAHT